MKVVGIIAEFNPFHEGHAYLIRQAKEQCHADHIIVCMSNYYVQRGEPAIIPPNERVRAALSYDVDLVLALPACVSTVQRALPWLSMITSSLRLRRSCIITIR